MQTLKQQVINNIGYEVLDDHKRFFIAYPCPLDTEAVSHEERKKEKGYQTLINTINSKQPMILRKAAFNYIVNTMTETQLLDLLMACCEDD